MTLTVRCSSPLSQNTPLSRQVSILVARICVFVFIGIVLVLFHSKAFAEDIISIQSKQTAPILIELYSSQGCSSCPPAQKWVSEFKDSPLLWETAIPMVFHVDYWNYIGWKDPFSQKSFSARQRDFARQDLVSSVYTPGFVVNGQEWTGWFKGQGIKRHHAHKNRVGVLSADLSESSIDVNFSPLANKNAIGFNALDVAYVNVAVLGFNLKTSVTRGENAHKTLKDDFVVLGYNKQRYTKPAQKIGYPSLSQPAQQYGIVVWLTTKNKLTPVQALGGFLPDEWKFRK